MKKKVLDSTKIKLNKTKKVKCQYCEKKISHMIVILDKKGDIHVHAPFDNKYIMNQFLESIIKEQKNYNKKISKVVKEEGGL